MIAQLGRDCAREIYGRGSDRCNPSWCSIPKRRELETMIVEYTRYKIDSARREAFEMAYKGAGGSLEASSHCLDYELSRCTEDPDHFILRIEWDSEEGHLKGFRSSPEFRAFFAAVQPFVKDIEEMRHYEVLSTSTKSKQKV
jgi:quinol monooxygenase YgiN